MTSENVFTMPIAFSQFFEFDLHEDSVTSFITSENALTINAHCFMSLFEFDSHEACVTSFIK